MKKNGNKPGKFIRFVAILCAAILTIQVLPAAMPVSVAVQASENEDSSSDKQAEEEKKKEEEEKKEEKKEEEKKEEEKKEEEKKEEENKTEESKDEEKKEESSSDDQEKTSDNKEDKKEETSSDNQEKSSDNKEDKKEETSSDNQEKPSDNNEEKKEEAGTSPSGDSDNTKDDSKPDSVPGKKNAPKLGAPNPTNENETDNKKNGTGSNENNNNDTNGPKQNPDETKQATSLTNEDIEIKMDGKNVAGQTIEVGKDKEKIELTATVKEEVDDSGYTFKWEYSTSSAGIDTEAIEVNRNKATITSRKGRGGGQYKLEATFTPKQGGEVVKQTVNVKIYTEYGLDQVKLSKMIGGNETSLSNGDSIQIKETLKAVPSFVEGATEDDQKPDNYSYQWQKKEGDTFKNIEGDAAKKKEYTPEKSGMYRIVVSREANDDNLRLATSSAADIEVKKINVTPTVKVWGKNFDNTKTVLAPEDESNQDITVDWGDDLPDNLKDNKDKLQLKLGGNKLTYENLEYENVGSVSENTEVGIGLNSDSSGKTYSIDLLEGSIDSEDYEVEVTYEKTTISALNWTFASVGEVKDDDSTYIEKSDDDGAIQAIWVKGENSGEITVTPLNGFSISKDYTDANSWISSESTLKIPVSNSGDNAFYAKNAKGEIGKITTPTVKFDKDSPSVTTVGITRISKDKTKNKYNVTDSGSGIKKISYKITSDIITSDNANMDGWSTVFGEDNSPATIDGKGDFEFEIPVPNYGYVYINVIDNVGNSEIKSQHSVIYEGDKPKVNIECNNADDYTKSEAKEITITANDLPKTGASGIQKIMVALYQREEDQGEKEITNALKPVGDYTYSDNMISWIDKLDNESLDDQALLAKAEELQSVSVQFTVEKPDLNGTYVLKVRAYDNCGNESDLTEKELNFDNTPPKYSITLAGGGGVGKDGKYYCKEISNLTVTFTDELCVNGSYNVTIKNGDKTWPKKLTELTSADGSSYSGSISFTGSELLVDEKYLEGEYEILVTAKDSAENAIQDISLTNVDPAEMKINEKQGENDWKAASFILDTTPPKASIVLDDKKGSEFAEEWYYGASSENGLNVTFEEKYLKEAGGIYSVTLEDQNGKTTTKQLKDASGNKGDVNFSTDDISNLEDGVINVYIIATDVAGNDIGDNDKALLNEMSVSPETIKEDSGWTSGSNGWKVASFILDKTAPNVSIKMEHETADQDGHYYYNAKNCKISIKFDDNGNKLGDGKGTIEYSAVVAFPDGNEEIGKWTAQPGVNDTTIEHVFGSNDISKIGDGTHHIVVTAKDLAGNVATKVTEADSSYNIKSQGCVFTGDSTSPYGEFILDTTPPEVISIETTPDEEPKDYPPTSNKLYADTKSVYYNRATTVTVKVLDTYATANEIKGSVMRDGTEIKVSDDDKPKSDNTVSVIFKLEGDHVYSDFTVDGTDKAGNKLALRNAFTHQANDNLKYDAANGKVTTEFGKIIDTKAPTATISYTSSDKANMYSNETSVKGRKSAYYNKPVTVKMDFADNYAFDGEKLYAGLEGKETKQTSAEGKTKYSSSISITKDGRSVYTAYGTDRALNATDVTEKAPVVDPNTTSEEFADTKNKAGAFKDNKLNSQKAFQAMYEIVLDQVAPTFKLAVSSPSSTNKKLNSQGNRYYFNKQYTATYTVSDTNYDASKITVKKGSITNNSYNSETASISSYPVTISSKTKVFTDSVNSDGVYRYAIYGSDKAGNALVPSEKTNLQTTSKSKDVVDADGEKKKGSLEGVADISNHIVVDQVKPEGDLEIKTGKTTIYTMNTKGNVTYAEPYRKETNASVKISVDDKVERSPVNISYKVESTSSSNNKNVSNSTYKYDNSAETSLSGKQIFRVTEYKFTDLAGNVTTYSAENQIYLDKDLPNIDKIAPTINIVAKAKSGTNGYRNGQPLFRSDVPLSIVVSDPDSSNSSSGLADVTYQMYVGGKLVGGDTKQLHKANTKTHKENYKDEKLTYKISPTVTVNGKSHNNNDLEVVVTAYDNAGNKREMKYNFGIDVTAPTVKVTYDNNSAQNGEYFKANRVATIAVTERNFEPSKFKISTQNAASISGWSHTSKGGNGDNDVWTAHVTYSRDGNYTLEVSGEDLLGNKANSIQYEGTAPRKFTIDKTAPSITVTYDNNDVRNEKYYKATRTATINVNDVNFGGQNDIRVQASGGGKAPSVVFNGNTATLHFPEDGIYIFNGTVTDKAGNQTTIPVQTEFVIDTVPPVLVFEDGKPFDVEKAKEENKSDHPVNWQFFKEGDFEPKVTVIDTNISTAEQDAIFEIFGQKMANRFTGTAKVHPDDNTKFDMSFDSMTFRVSEEIDDVYHVRAFAVDLAGNESEVIEFEFSINRFGSSYAADKDDNPDNTYAYSTYGYIRDSYYHNSTRDLTIYEFNTNSLKKDSQKVEMMKDGNTANVKTLVPGTDYTFEEVPNKGDKLKTYQYKILSSVFEEEGDYSFTISSVDEAGHHNTTSRVHKGKDENNQEKLYVDSFPIDFVIDKTPPTNQLAGIRSDSKKVTVNDRKLVVDVYPEDAQTAVNRVEIRRWVGDTLGFSTPNAGDDPAQTIVYEYYDDETNPKPADTDLIKYEDLAAYTDEATDRVNISYEIQDNQNWQWVEVISTDLAGNESEDIRAGAPGQGEGVRYSENRRGFLVTTNAFSQIVNNLAARIGAAAVILLLLALLILRKKKNEAKENTAA